MAKPPTIDTTELEKRFTALLIAGDLERGLRHGRDMIRMLGYIEAKIFDLEHRLTTLQAIVPNGSERTV